MLLGLSLAACRNRVCGEAAFGLTDWDQAPDLEAEYEGADVLDDAVDEEGEGWGTDFFDDLDEEGWGFAYRLTATSTGSSTAIRFFAGAFITPDAVLPEGVDLDVPEHLVTDMPERVCMFWGEQDGSIAEGTLEKACTEVEAIAGVGVGHHVAVDAGDP